MSLLTSFLNLFKYEETDEGDFNIQEALNDNWDKIDVAVKSNSDNITVLQGDKADQSSLDTHTTNDEIHTNITSGTAAPTGGSDGDVYLQYE